MVKAAIAMDSHSMDIVVVGASGFTGWVKIVKLLSSPSHCIAHALSLQRTFVTPSVRTLVRSTRGDVSGVKHLTIVYILFPPFLSV